MVLNFLDHSQEISLQDLLDFPSLKELAGNILNAHQFGLFIFSPEGEIFIDSASDTALVQALRKSEKGKPKWQGFQKKTMETLPKKGKHLDHSLEGSLFFRIIPIINEMDVIGGAGIGPCFIENKGRGSSSNISEKLNFSKNQWEKISKQIPKFSSSGIEKISQLISSILDVSIFSSYKCYLTNVTHIQSITQSYQDLEKANKELQESYEKLKEIDRMKSNFLAVVSHELRTPLTSILGYSEMLMEGIAGDLNKNQSEYVNVIMEKGDQLLHLIREILNLTKIEAGQVKLTPHLLDPLEIFDSALETIRPFSQKKVIQFEKEIAKGIPEKMMGDRDKLLQILNNLFSNAVKFTDNGGKVKITLEVSPFKGSERTSLNPEEKYFLFSIKDTGIGIPKKDQEKIFEKFYQVDNSSTREFGGTGLGLSIVKSFVEIHGGAIWVESEVNKGTKILFTIPIIQK